MEGLISVIKRFQNRINKSLVNFKKSPKERLTVEYIETRQELLEKDWESFKDTYTKLYETFKSDEIDQKILDIYDNAEDDYITYKTLMKTTLNKIRVVFDPVQNSEGPSVNKLSNSLGKLPKIAIPMFNGNYEDWTTFHDLFVSLVHKNYSLDNVQKLHYLKSHVTGEAEQLIRHIPITEANYVQCWEQLKRRYSNKKYLTNCILNRLFGQKRIHTESGSSLKELLDTTNDCLNALINLGVTSWDVFVIHVMKLKLDPETRKQWELNVNDSDSINDLPTFEQMKLFIENRFRALECFDQKTNSGHQAIKRSSHTPRAMVATTSSQLKCELCSEPHKLCFCKRFANLSIETRRDFVSKNKICFNCLGRNHTVYNCKKNTTCRICQKRHHSLLHVDSERKNESEGIQLRNEDSSNHTSRCQVVSCLSTGKVLKPRQVLLATALIKAESKTGEHHTIRALIDQGSQACFITEATVQYLNLKKIPVTGLISVLGEDRSTTVKYMVHLTIRSRIEADFKLSLNAYVLSKITSYLPERSISSNLQDLVCFNNLCLADPGFNTPNKIDLLLGADAYSRIIKDGILRSPSGSLIAQSSTLGWVVSGAVEPGSKENKNISIKNINVFHSHITEDDMLRKFWEIEETSSRKKILTPEEKKCEALYDETTRRDKDGRYIVKLPFRDERNFCKSGHSREIAKVRFLALEKRLEKNQHLKEKYTEVINEYLNLGHMKEIKGYDDKKQEAVYLPHHAVIRNDKITTKVRVVFNASEKNCKGVSLNDTLMVGPTLQADLRHTVMKWRLHPIGLVADIVKMYRQVKVADEDTMYQRILWRENSNKAIQDYELMTVTFGTASAPYQAVRTLRQIAIDEGKNYPLAADKVLNCFYMDDLMTGCDSVEEGLEIYKQLKELLLKGGFILQKWNSNNQEILNSIIEQEDLLENNQTDEKQENEDKKVDIKLDRTIKILGLTWNRMEDAFQYSVNLPPPTTAPVTKRTIISDIARLFDPLGWLAPSIILAKTFIQRLWLAGVTWDEELNEELINEWGTYREELSLLSRVRIPRWLSTKPTDDIELHGFSDASKTAYSAVIYLRIKDKEDNIRVALVVAKTRVAPVKQISIPRLELCGAVLLANLLAETAEVLNISKNKISAWTDSTIVLAWLNSHPSRWKTFVANRTSEILTTTKASQWFHVRTNDNPADCASRGMQPRELIDNSLWFSGPSFLTDQNIQYTRPSDLNVELEESVKTHVALIPKESDIFERYSSLTKLIRIVAYCRRFLQRNKTKTYLQKSEIDAALECCLRETQKVFFRIEYIQLQTNGYLQVKSSKLKQLCPFIDKQGLMRVRGRIEKAPLHEQTKHPIVLPKDSHMTKLIVADGHLKTLHGGLQLTLNYLRTAYWILGARSLIKHYVRNCVICAKHQASIRNQMMGSLPTVRCIPTRPFLHSGVDYAGPINIRTTKGRGHRAHKGYICLFVCMSTRALHLEVVSDMSTQAFLAAFKRFVARRGHCAKIWSDNGTTFLGASRELQHLASLQASIAPKLEAMGTEWHFIPPHSPNFGGLWEAAVKSTKFHLKRVIGDSNLTYEELSTLLNQIEACLNSRPISVINVEDPGEPLPLTPGHFLIGEPIVNVPDKSVENISVSYLSRWQFAQRMVQSFWKRWSNEYLLNLMNRYKWSSRTPEPNIGDVVLIKEDDLPPSRWLLGRVIQKHPGDDNITRVVTLRTKTSTIKRPTSKLCILPISDT